MGRAMSRTSEREIPWSCEATIQTAPGRTLYAGLFELDVREALEEGVSCAPLLNLAEHQRRSRGFDLPWSTAERSFSRHRCVTAMRFCMDLLEWR